MQNRQRSKLPTGNEIFVLYLVRVERTHLLRAEQTGVSQSLKNLLRLFGRYQDATVHFHTGDLVLPRKALYALMLRPPRRVFVTAHSPSEYLDPASSRARTWAHVVRRRVQTVICTSDYSHRTQTLFGIPADRLCVIRNGVDSERYGHGSAEKVRRGPLAHVPADAKLIIATARLVPGKRPLDALAAFQGIASEFPEAHLVFVGTGESAEDVRAAIAPGLRGRVHLVGFQSNVQDWLAAADVWLHTSDEENCSLALLEAFASGCVMVANLCKGNDEVIRDGENALGVPVGDVEAAAHALRIALTDKTLREKLSAGARATAHRLSLESMSAQYVDVYRRAGVPV